MATQFIIAKPDERSEWVPITMTMHDDVVLVRIPRSSTPTTHSAMRKRSPSIPGNTDPFTGFPDNEEPTWEDAEWQ